MLADMTSAHRQPRFYGETFEALRPAFCNLHDNAVQLADGRLEIGFFLDTKEGVPLVRAIMRAEAEMLLEAADVVDGPDFLRRDPDEVVGEAFLRVAGALGAPVDHMEVVRPDEARTKPSATRRPRR